MSTPDPIEVYVKGVIQRKRIAMGIASTLSKGEPTPVDTIHSRVEPRTIQRFKEKLGSEPVKRTKAIPSDTEWIYKYYEQAYRFEEKLCSIDDKKLSNAISETSASPLPSDTTLVAWIGKQLTDAKEPLSEEQAIKALEHHRSKQGVEPVDPTKAFEKKFPFEKMPERKPADVPPSRVVDPLKVLLPPTSNTFHSKDEEIYTRIEYNEHKITFLRAQWELLDVYLSKAIETIPEKDRAEAKRRAGISNYSPITHSTPPDLPPTATLLETLDEVILKSNICLAALRQNGLPV